MCPWGSRKLKNKHNSFANFYDSLLLCVTGLSLFCLTRIQRARVVLLLVLTAVAAQKAFGRYSISAFECL